MKNCPTSSFRIEERRSEPQFLASCDLVNFDFARSFSICMGGSAAYLDSTLLKVLKQLISSRMRGRHGITCRTAFSFEQIFIGCLTVSCSRFIPHAERFI